MRVTIPGGPPVGDMPHFGPTSLLELCGLAKLLARNRILVRMHTAIVLGIGFASGAGYSVREEFPIFLAIFAGPALVAGFIWYKFA